MYSALSEHVNSRPPVSLALLSGIANALFPARAKHESSTMQIEPKPETEAPLDGVRNMSELVVTDPKTEPSHCVPIASWGEFEFRPEIKTIIKQTKTNPI